MLFKITSAVAITLMMASLAGAQTNRTNRYLVPEANRGVDTSIQEIPIISGQSVRARQSTNASATTNRGTTPAISPSPASPATTNTIIPDNVGDNYFQENHGGCNSGCGDGGCGCNQGGCCGAYNACTSECCEEYVRVFGGWNDLNGMGLGAVGAPGREMNFRDGWGLGTAFGEYINCNLRRELELAYRHNSADNITTNGQVSGALTGNIQAYTTMANLVYEMHNIDLAGFRPYAGGGIGAAYVDADFASGGATFAISDAAFAYQGFVGLEKQVNCNARGFVEYRFLGTTDLDLESAGGTTAVQYEADSVFVGLHFSR